MRIVIAPDSFKGTMAADLVAEAIETGLARVLPAAEVLVRPVADGGEGRSRRRCAPGTRRGSRG